MSEVEALLNSLRDIQEPIAPASTSIWLIGANLLLILFITLLVYLGKQRRREGWRREALLLVDQARKDNPRSGTVMLAKVLRKIVLMRTGNGHEMYGDAWLSNLDRHFSTTWFSTEEGKIFGNALYQNHEQKTSEYQLLCDNIDRLIRRLPNKPDATLLSQL